MDTGNVDTWSLLHARLNIHRALVHPREEEMSIANYDYCKMDYKAVVEAKQMCMYNTRMYLVIIYTRKVHSYCSGNTYPCVIQIIDYYCTV